jgi:hypothetical protein
MDNGQWTMDATATISWGGRPAAARLSPQLSHRGFCIRRDLPPPQKGEILCASDGEEGSMRGETVSSPKKEVPDIVATLRSKTARS